MSNNTLTKNELHFSKYLSYILRHKPEDIGLKLGKDGWVSTDELINAINEDDNNGIYVALPFLQKIVADDDKHRYSFKDDYKYIRANQGHSVKDLDFEFEKVVPPEYLYHGTSSHNYDLILESKCIKPMTRNYVHLSSTVETAKKVGSRHGEVVVLVIDTKAMLQDNCEFFISENGVYLVDIVNTKYIKEVIK